MLYSAIQFSRIVPALKAACLKDTKNNALFLRAETKTLTSSSLSVNTLLLPLASLFLARLVDSAIKPPPPKDRGKLPDTPGAVNEKSYIRDKAFPFLFQDHPDVLNSSMKNDFFSKRLFVPGSEDDCNGEKHETDAE